MGDMHRENDGDFNWIVDSVGNRVDADINNTVAGNDHLPIQSIDDTPRSIPNSLAHALIGPGSTRRLLRKVVAGYGHVQNVLVRLSMERHLTTSYRDAMRRICSHMNYSSTPPSIQDFQSLLTAPIVKNAKNMYMPRVVVVPPISGRLMLQAHENIQLYQDHGNGDFYTDPKKQWQARDRGRKVLDRFPWGDYEKVWNDGEKEQGLTWEIWVTDSSLVRGAIDGPHDLLSAVQMVRERQLQPLGGLRRVLSLYTELPEDVSLLELTGIRYGTVCICPSRGGGAETKLALNGLFIGGRDRGDELILRNERHVYFNVVPALKIF